jgi:voltage-gated sodium channel
MVKAWCTRMVDSGWFEPAMVALILFNAVLIGLETSPAIVKTHGDLLHQLNDAILVVFIAEALMKITASAPRYRNYFANGWNLFDLAIIVLSLIPATGEFALVARMIRVLRVLRLISAVPQLRLIVSTLVRSIPSMGHVVMLFSILFYIYGVTGYHLFHAADAERWGTLGSSLLTLFQMITLDDWANIYAKAREAHAWAWVFFVTFIVIGTFVVMNLFVAVVINNLEASKEAELHAHPATPEEVLAEIRRTREALARLENRIGSSSAAPGGETRSL